MNRRYKWRKLPQEIIIESTKRLADAQTLQAIQSLTEFSDIRNVSECKLYPKEIKVIAPSFGDDYPEHRTWIPFELIEPC